MAALRALALAVRCTLPFMALLPQAEASQAMLERRAEDLNAAELRVRELQVGWVGGWVGIRQAGWAPCLFGLVGPGV